MVVTSTGSQETLRVALGGQAGHPGLKIPQPAMRLGYFLGTLLLQHMLKVHV